ncbi:uncharacterized protein [Macrobrachium rosenbergii]
MRHAGVKALALTLLIVAKTGWAAQCYQCMAAGNAVVPIDHCKAVNPDVDKITYGYCKTACFKIVNTTGTNVVVRRGCSDYLPEPLICSSADFGQNSRVMSCYCDSDYCNGAATSRAIAVLPVAILATLFFVH